MFARLKDTIRIISYRPPVVHGPDAIIVPKKQTSATVAGKVIAFFLEAFIVLYAIGFAAEIVAPELERHLHIQKLGMSMVGVAGALGAVLFWIFHNFLNRLQVG